jgi:spore maturation protein CgeB
MRMVFLGLSITSSWGNGHATTYRGLVRELCARGHDVLFLERDVPWYADNRDLPHPPYGRTELYENLDELCERYREEIAAADFVLVGSRVLDGIEVGTWVQQVATGVVGFYDIDTPVTLAALDAGTCTYLSPAQIPRYDLYLSFAGGRSLKRLERELGASRVRALYCSVDPRLYRPDQVERRWDLGYLGTYGDDRQPGLDRLLLQCARAREHRRFLVAGAQYPARIHWPANVDRIEHLPPFEHSLCYNRMRYTLNLTRAAMRRAGHSPSVRLFEASACGVPILTDPWDGLDSLLEPGKEILVVRSRSDVTRILEDLPEAERRAIGNRARRRVLGEHTAAHRAAQLETHVLAAASNRRSRVASDGRKAVSS